MKKVIFTFLCLISTTLSTCYGATKTTPNVLGRMVPLNDLCEDFESNNWSDDYNQGNDHWHDTNNPNKRGPESLQRIPTPPGGKTDSSWALSISRINDPKQQEMLSPAFGMKLGRNLTRKDMPVFIVRVLLPTFKQWGQAYGFGFRQQTHASNITNVKNDEYSTSIWVKKNQNGVNFYFRAANDQRGDEPSGIIVEPGWWTLAIAFDDKGVGHYYISRGTDIPTDKDEVFSTTKFPAPNNPLMDDVVYSYFAISANTNARPKFVIDDYEVWISK